MNSQKHSGYHILLAYHICIFSDLIVMWIHTSILLNLKNKTKLEVKKKKSCFYGVHLLF